MNGYRYVGPDRFYGIPVRDLSADEFAALDPEQRRKVRLSPAYAEIPDETLSPPPLSITLDPLGELDDASYEALTPADKGKRTKEANTRAEAEAKAAEEAAKAQADATAREGGQ